jgi:Xaa-Pro aminopeptidase
MWPVSGTYSSEQRAIYGYVVEYHKVLLQEIRAGRTDAEVKASTEERMRPVYESWKFPSEDIREAAGRDFGQITHGGGMHVHDGSAHHTRPYEPGMVFAPDPSIVVRGERPLYCRIEDTVVVTETGCEVLTAAAPVELDDVEALMKEQGLLQAYPESR